MFQPNSNEIESFKELITYTFESRERLILLFLIEQE